MRLFLDVTRLRQRGRRSTPSGIDRVEFAYFTYALDSVDDLDVDFVVFQRVVAGLLRRERAEDLRHIVETSWSRLRAPQEDEGAQALRLELERPPRQDAQVPLRVSAPSGGSLWGDGLLFTARDMMRARVRLDRRVNASPQERPVYLHTSHTQLDRPAIPQWLAGADVAPVFFLHDVIPLDYPEFCRPGEQGRHLARLTTIAEHALLVLVNSRATAEAAQTQFDVNGLRVPPFAVVPLGIEDCFRASAPRTPPQTRHPYAVVVGTIEPRKNLAFLLAVWRRLVEKHGDATPRLVIVGRRGWENENVLDYLERSSLMAPFLIEASDLSDLALAEVMAGARVVLAPSMAEGFDLPVAEALSIGAPVVASDIPVHREIGGALARYVDPLDGPGWMREIEAHCLAAEPPPRAQGYAALSWREHVDLGLAHIREALARQAAAQGAGAA